MILSVIWTIGMAASILYGCCSGTAKELTAAFTQGMTDAASFCLNSGVMMVFWCGLFGIMERIGLGQGLARLLSPLLRRLFPRTAKHDEVFACLCANVSANLLGLGNAATPMGIRAAQGIAALPHTGKELARLVVLNTASIQLLPTTVASVRAAYGCTTPMDILPCVLVSSLASVAAGLIALEVLHRL